MINQISHKYKMNNKKHIQLILLRWQSQNTEYKLHIHTRKEKYNSWKKVEGLTTNQICLLPVSYPCLRWEFTLWTLQQSSSRLNIICVFGLFCIKGKRPLQLNLIHLLHSLCHSSSVLTPSSSLGMSYGQKTGNIRHYYPPHW